VNYHKLLDNLTHSYVQDWINLQAADARSGKPGADLRLADAQALQEKLKLILAGKPPYDIFVRWGLETGTQLVIDSSSVPVSAPR
jgi:hypothetical protein